MCLADFENILFANERLTAGHHVQMRAELRALVYDRLHFLEREAVLAAVLRRPTALALTVAGARRVKEDDVREVALVLFTVFTHTLGADIGAVAHRHNTLAQGRSVHIFQNRQHIACPDVVGVMHRLAERIEILFGKQIACQLLGGAD